MSLYNLIHGMNPYTPLLGSILDLSVSGWAEGKWDVGRFRDIYLESRDGKTVIALYTRNGGSNRECWHYDSPEWGNEGCKHESFEEETDETEYRKHDRDNPAELAKGEKWLSVFCGSERLVSTGKRIVETRYRCLEPGSSSCACPGCVISYQLPKHPQYICDRDDDFDCTYATIYFSIPEEFVELIGILAKDKTAKPDSTPEERFFQFMDKLKSADKDDPQFSRVKSAMEGLFKQMEASQ